MNNDNSKAIMILCSQLGASDEIKPYTTSQWSKLADQLMEIGAEPKELLNFNRADCKTILSYDEEQTDRFLRLLDRSASLSFQISDYENSGISIITRADREYPIFLKRRLKKLCPPLFYCAGDPTLFRHYCIGFAGSRNVDSEDIEFTVTMAQKAIENQYAIVSGGAKGIDSTATAAALQNNGQVIEYLSDSLLKKLKDRHTIQSIQDGFLLLASAFNPDTGFNVGNAMARNKYVYAQSESTIVVKADLNKGGTWSGADEGIKKKWCPVLCRKKETYPGNMELIKKGAIPIDTNWDGMACKLEEKQEPIPVQSSLFGIEDKSEE